MCHCGDISREVDLHQCIVGNEYYPFIVKASMVQISLHGYRKNRFNIHIKVSVTKWNPLVEFIVRYWPLIYQKSTTMIFSLVQFGIGINECWDLVELRKNLGSSRRYLNPSWEKDQQCIFIHMPKVKWMLTKRLCFIDKSWLSIWMRSMVLVFMHN